MAFTPGMTETVAVFLNPGDLYFHCPEPGRPPGVRLHTLLGSCVSVIVWHPERRSGGMSHIILPKRGKPDPYAGLDGRYGDEAITRIYQEVIRSGTLPPQFHVYVVGGGQMYMTRDALSSVGTRNVDAARSDLKKAGFRIRAEHVGQDHHRKVELDLMTGLVTVTCNNRQIHLSAQKPFLSEQVSS